VCLSEQLLKSGFKHLGSKQWQIECYPHPALIEIFSLSKRLKYKKGKVADKRAGQIKLAALLHQLNDSKVLKLVITDPVSQVLNESKIQLLKGQALKTNEDALDAIVCLYIAGLYAINHRGKTFGDLNRPIQLKWHYKEA
jgi:predicted RNase H-like nuclease